MKKPADLSYGVEEIPPPAVLWLAALQHVGVLALVMVFPLLIARAAGASPAIAAQILSAGMLALGLATIAQARALGSIGSGYLAPTGFQAVYLGPSLAAAQAGGLPLVFGMTIFSGLVEVGLSRIWRPLRPYLPPELSGLVVLLTGLVTAAVGIRYLMAGHDGEPAARPDWVAAGFTLAVMVGLNLWTKGMLRMFCALIGLVAGYLLAVWLGLGSAAELAAIGEMSLFAMPRFDHVAWSFDAAMTVPFAVAGVAAALNTSANVTIFQRLNDSEWVRPDLRSIGRGTLTDGLAASTSGALGSCGLSTLSASVGVIIATGVASRRIAYAIGAIVIVLAFLPKFTAVLVATPAAVVAGALIFIACFILIGGMQIITSRMLDARKSLVIGVSVSAALAVLMFPDAVTAAPSGLRPLLGSALVTGTVLAFGLNLLFRLGVRQKVRLSLEPAGDYPRAIEDFFTERGKSWGARPDIIRRAVFGVTQLTEAVIENCAPKGRLTIDASFDEFNLDVHVGYHGELLELPDSRPTEREIREDDDGARRLAGFMLRRNADRAQSTRKDGRAAIHFHFDH
ncbi:MAG: solute carrier family 23 protein [Burkholderiales bacterium]